MSTRNLHITGIVEKDSAIHSIESTKPIILLIGNLTYRNVNVLWIDYNGNFISYKVVQPRKFVYINTFETHPWIFRDTDTGEAMHDHNTFIVYPELLTQFRNEGRNAPTELKRIGINFPMRSLLCNSLWATYHMLNERKLSIDDVQLPGNLKDYLHQISNLVDVIRQDSK